MQIVEFEWLKQHQDELSPEDHKRLEELGIFKLLETGEVNMPAGKFIAIMREVIDVVEGYMDLDDQKKKLVQILQQHIGVEVEYKDKPVISESWVDQMFTDNVRRKNHIVGVVVQLPNRYKELGFLHDVGYSTKVAHYTNFHPIDGAIYALECDFSTPVIMGVLFHSKAQAEAELLGFGKLYADLGNLITTEDSNYIDAITIADMQTSPDGKAVTLDQRLRDIFERYPKGTIVHTNMKNQESYFRKLIEKSQMR